jgi:hypothetical protein
VAREIEVEPSRARAARLKARKIWDGDDQTATGLQDSMRFPQRAGGIVYVFEYMPDDDLIEARGWVLGVFQVLRDPDFGSRIGSSRGLRADLEPVDFEALLGKRPEDHTAPATQVENSSARSEFAGEKRGVAFADGPHERFDRGLELPAGASVVFFGVEGPQPIRAQHRVKAAEPAPSADDHFLFHCFHFEPPNCDFGGADRTRRYALVGAWSRQDADVVFV